MTQAETAHDPLRRRVLVLNVDDYEAGRYATSRVLRQAGFDVLEAASGEEALSETRDHHPDLVLLDVNLPDVDGFEVCRRLKEAASTSGIPVLYLSGYEDITLDILVRRKRYSRDEAKAALGQRLSFRKAHLEPASIPSLRPDPAAQQARAAS